MTEAVSAFLGALVIGVLVAAPVGAMAVLLVHRTLDAGVTLGLATGLGIATADGIYAAIAAFGLAVAWSDAIPMVPVRVIGGIVLVWLGIRAMRAVPREPDSAPRAAAAPGAVYASAVALTLTNPMTIASFAAIFAGSGLIARGSTPTALAMTAGVFSGSLAWWILLVIVVAIARSHVGDGALRALTRFAGAALVVAGIVMAARALA